MEHLIEHGPNDIATVFGRAFELAMRDASASGTSAPPPTSGRIPAAATRTATSPSASTRRRARSPSTSQKTAGHDGTPFYPQSLERGRRSVRAVMLAVAEMYVKGVSTREAERVMRAFGLDSLSSTQVSRAAKLLDDELEAWRTRPLGQITYLVLDARYEKVRQGGIVRDAAVLSAIGVGPDERRRVLGVSVALSEAEVHWRASRPVECAGSRMSSAMITPDCGPPAGRSSAARHGNGRFLLRR
nr:transposase [uncultured Jannaschia sp.]